MGTKRFMRVIVPIMLIACLNFAGPVSHALPGKPSVKSFLLRYSFKLAKAQIPNCIGRCISPLETGTVQTQDDPCQGSSDCGWVECQPYAGTDIYYSDDGSGWTEGWGGIQCHGSDKMKFLSIDGHLYQNGNQVDRIAGATSNSYTVIDQEYTPCPYNNCDGDWELATTATMQLPHSWWRWESYPSYCYLKSGYPDILYCADSQEQSVP